MCIVDGCASDIKLNGLKKGRNIAFIFSFASDDLTMGMITLLYWAVNIKDVNNCTIRIQI